MNEELDRSRVIASPWEELTIYAPPRSKQDHRLDYPPGEPVEVHYDGAEADYREVLESGSMQYRGILHKFSREQLAWLKGRKKEVDRLLGIRAAGETA